jgi:hypothetical protein
MLFRYLCDKDSGKLLDEKKALFGAFFLLYFVSVFASSLVA